MFWRNVQPLSSGSRGKHSKQLTGAPLHGITSQKTVILIVIIMTSSLILMYLSSVQCLLLPWRWRQCVPLQHWYLSKNLHGDISQMSVILIFTAKRTWSSFRRSYWAFRHAYSMCCSAVFCFRSGFVVLDLEDVPAGTYNIVPSTFLPNQEGPFILTVKASCPISLARLQWFDF
jgi:hypothetical protein